MLSAGHQLIHEHCFVSNRFFWVARLVSLFRQTWLESFSPLLNPNIRGQHVLNSDICAYLFRQPNVTIPRIIQTNSIQYHMNTNNKAKSDHDINCAQYIYIYLYIYWKKLSWHTATSYIRWFPQFLETEEMWSLHTPLNSCSLCDFSVTKNLKLEVQSKFAYNECAVIHFVLCSLEWVRVHPHFIWRD